MLVKFKGTILLLCVFPGPILFPSSFFISSLFTQVILDCFYNYHANNMRQQVAPVIIIIII